MGTWLPRPLPGLLLALLVLLAAAGLANALAAPAPWQRDIGAAGDAPYLSSLHAPETHNGRTYRWTAPGARLHLHGAPTTPTRLTLHLNGAPLIERFDEAHIRLAQGEQTVAEFAPLPGWRSYHLYLPPGTAAGTGLEATPLALVAPTARPSSGDDRYLGFVLDGLALAPLRAPTNPDLFALLLAERGLLLAGGLALLAGALLTLALWVRALLLLARPVLPAPDALRPTLRAWWVWLWVGAPLAGLAGWLVWWAHSDLPGFARAFPLTPGGLALAGWLLAGGWLLGALAWAWLTLPPNTRLVRFNAAQAGGLLLLLAWALLLLPGPLALRALGGLLLLLLPGGLATLLLVRHAERAALVLGFVALCGGLTLAGLLLLALHLLPGPLTGWLVGGLFSALSLGLLLALWRAPLPPAAPFPQVPPGALLALLLALLLGGLLRLVLLGSAELQGDEAFPLHIALGALAGRDELLFLRTKGPLESLLPAGLLALLGQGNEAALRLPFALAGVAGAWGCFVLAWSMWRHTAPRLGAWVGALAAGLLALDGLTTGFARIVQYQSIVVLLALGALWCGWRFANGADHPYRYLLGGAAMAAVGVLAHYDGVFVLPALAWLLLLGGWRRGWNRVQWIRGVTLPALLLGGIVASFYVPFFLHEWVSTNTTVYLLWRVRGQQEGSAPFNNLLVYYHLATFYNTTFLMGALTAALAGGLLAWLWRWLLPRWLGALAALLLLAGMLVQLTAAELLVLPGGRNAALLVLGLPLALLLLARATPEPLRLVLLWFAVGFGAMAFLIGDPRTHFYVAHPAGALLVALALVQLAHWLAARRLAWARAALAYAGAAVVALSLPYAYILFLRQTPEYQRAFPAARPALYTASYGDVRPRGGYFGFPHRDGWKVVGLLYERGLLRGSYDSTARPHIANWYTRGALFCDYFPDYVFRTYLDDTFSPRGYNLYGYVLVDGVKKLEIYTGAPAPPTPHVFALDQATIDAADARPLATTPRRGLFPQAAPQHTLDAAWQNGARLHGYDLPFNALAPGQPALLTLYWDAARRLGDHVALVVELADAAGQPVQQGTPHCRPAPPETWHWSGVRDVTQAVVLPEALPPGTYTLRVGLRDTQAGRWLPLADGSTRYELAPVTVRPLPADAARLQAGTPDNR